MISKETQSNRTIFKVTGDVTANEIILEATQYLAGVQTDTSMWDFTQTNRLKITTVEIKGIVDSITRAPKDGKVRKVALLGSKNINIGLGKLFTAFAHMAGLPNNYKVFRDMSNALEWLDNDG